MKKKITIFLVISLIFLTLNLFYCKIFTYKEGDSMNRVFLNNQIEEAKYNYNYFFMQMIIKILRVCFKLSFVLLLSSIFNYLIINILAIICTIISFVNIFDIIKKYNYIINYIKNTICIDYLFELDFNVISSNLFKGIFNYGK